MKRTFLLFACASTLLLAACTGDSQLPNPTGKGWIRAINAIPGSPEIGFLIEELPLGGMVYKASAAPDKPYDDISYDFNFEILNPGDQAFTRVATQTLKVEADRDHIFVVDKCLQVRVWLRLVDTAVSICEGMENEGVFFGLQQRGGRRGSRR